MPYVWDPFEELRRMQYRMSRLFEDLPDYIESSNLPARQEMTQVPYVDVIDRDKDIVITADLPGVAKDDIKLSVRDNMLEISAERKAEQEVREEGYLRRERGYAGFYRTIRLPAPVDEGKAQASFNNGVLEVTLPKTTARKGSNIAIK